MDEYYSVEKLEENVVVCENRKTRKIEYISKEKIVGDIKQGDILTLKDGKYQLDYTKTKEIKSQIAQKVKKLWKK